jgi:hypothetical protein
LIRSTRALPRCPKGCQPCSFALQPDKSGCWINSRVLRPPLHSSVTLSPPRSNETLLERVEISGFQLDVQVAQRSLLLDPSGFDFGWGQAHTAGLRVIGSGRSPLLQPNRHGQGCFVSDGGRGCGTRDTSSGTARGVFGVKWGWPALRIGSASRRFE